jgi:hypothetical protein
MDKKKLLLIIGGAVVAIVAIIVALSFIGKGEPEATPGGNVKVNADVALTDAEKANVKGGTEKFVTSLGNYGWYPDLIKNPQVAAGDENFDKLFKEEHTTIEDSQAALRTLTNSTNFDQAINKLAYSVPFSVETRLLGEITVPDYPTVEGDRTFAQVNVPIESTVSYIANSIGYTDEAGTWHDSKAFVQQFTFEGELNLQFGKSGGKWVVSGFTNTVGVLATDPMTFSNGDLISEYLATSSNQLPVN